MTAVAKSASPASSPMRPGGPSALSERLIENQDRFLRFLEQRVGSRQTAEEILQDAFVRFFEKGGELRDGELVVAWFYRILRNAIIDHYRKKSVEHRVMDAVAAESATQVEPDDALMEQTCSCVVQLLETLKPEYAEAIRRIELESVSVSDFAAEAKISPNNAAVRLHRARQSLRSQTVALCGAGTSSGCEDCSC